LAIFPEPSNGNYIRYSGGETYLIPTILAGKVERWDESEPAARDNRARLPATRTALHDLLPEERDSNSVFISWDPEWVLRLTKEAPGGNIVEQSPEFGLAKTKTITPGKDGKEYVGYGYLAYDDGHGINTIVIGCGVPSEAVPKSCQHRFINKGRHFYFRHRPEDVTNWQRMQQRILEVINSFEVHPRS
jgi:hypothetical protein